MTFPNNNKTIMRIYLNVPYEEKDIAKKKGCHWDGQKKQWFIDNPIHMDQYMRWMPKHLLKSTDSKPIKHTPFVNTNISKDRAYRLSKKKTRR